MAYHANYSHRAVRAVRSMRNSQGSLRHVMNVVEGEESNVLSEPFDYTHDAPHR